MAYQIGLHTVVTKNRGYLNLQKTIYGYNLGLDLRFRVEDLVLNMK